MNHYFLIGIGGVSMSAIALILKNQGHKVSGSDIKQSETINKLLDKGVNVYIGHKEENISGDEIVIYTAAIKDDNPELIKAKSLGLKIYERAEFLGKLMTSFRNVINIAGTHGKTTTTSMIGFILKKANLLPTILVGADVEQLGGNYLIGSNKYLVAEACEYVDSFLKFKPTIGVILNIDNDHLDYFKDIEHIKKSFNSFARLLPHDGFLVVNADDKNTIDSLDNVTCKVFSYSTNSKYADFYADNLSVGLKGYTFDIYHNGLFLAHVELSIPGIHNVSNALAAFAVCYLLGIDAKIIAYSLYEFNGAKRRIEFKGTVNGAIIYDDYAHHPTEIITTLKTLKEICKGRLIAVFQPHTYTRLKNLLLDFANSLKLADVVILTDVYAAREKNIYNISSVDLLGKLKDINVDCVFISKFEDIANFLLDELKQNDIIVTIGAGNVNQVISILFEETDKKAQNLVKA
ncbi:UDP-N-acetylmuramate--L-alanine ligase [Caldicellulosiruptoraceae bacterium PP1]